MEMASSIDTQPKQPDTHMTPPNPLTMTVPDAGRLYFGLCRNAAYAAAKRGEIPVVRIGKLLRVPIRALEQKLDSTLIREAI